MIILPVSEDAIEDCPAGIRIATYESVLSYVGHGRCLVYVFFCFMICIIVDICNIINFVVELHVVFIKVGNDIGREGWVRYR